MDPLRKGIAIGMMFGSSKEAELNDKEVEIDVGDILDALTGIFTYNPEDEDPQGDPPGPWDGYSLFTIDLTAVKQSLEDIIAALQQHDPDYDPDETPPEDAVEDLIEENEQQEQTIEDLTEQVEECDQCKADVIAKLQEYDPDFDPQTCEDIPPEIDEVAGYNPDPTIPIEDILPILGESDIVEVEDNSYYFDFYSVQAYYNSTVAPRKDVKRNIYHHMTFTDGEETYHASNAGWRIDIYTKATHTLFDTISTGPFSSGGLEPVSYKMTSLSINYTTKAFDYIVEQYRNGALVNTLTGSTPATRYIDTASPNPRYKIKNG